MCTNDGSLCEYRTRTILAISVVWLPYSWHINCPYMPHKYMEYMCIFVSVTHIAITCKVAVLMGYTLALHAAVLDLCAHIE